MTAGGKHIAAARLGALRFARELRYGENPHQRAALYLDEGAGIGAATATLIQGKPLGYNNLLDADGAFSLVAEFDPSASAAVAIIKHGMACGAALRPDAAAAYESALACDPVSAFGGVIAANRAIDAATAEAILGQFAELVIAPRIEAEAAALFARKPALRVLETGGLPDAAAGLCLRSIAGGVLVQEGDGQGWDEASLQLVSRRKPDGREMEDLRFAFLLCKHVKSNAIVIARNGAAIGIGGGQPSRIDAVAQAADKAAGQPDGAAAGVLASDGFFPFADGVQRAAEAGVSAIVQPGGSKRDREVVEAADKAGMAMLLSGARQFRH